MVYKDGFIRKEARNFEWVVRLKQEGDKITGDLLGGRASRGESVCADGDIKGSIKQGRVTFTVTYQGPCCYQEQENFVGALSDDGKSLTGTLEPGDVPKTDCRLAYAHVTATKR